MQRFGRRTAQILAAAALLTYGLPPRTARADAAQARMHFDRGRTYFEIDEYRKAIEEFKAAHVERADPAFLYNIAECYRHLGEMRDALVYYRRFLSLAPPGDRTRITVEKRIADLQALDDEPKPLPKALEGASRQPAAPGLAVAAPPGATPAVEPSAATLVGTPLPAAGPGADEPKPLYRRGWFIGTVAAVVVVGAVGVWALSRGQDIPGTPLGNQTAF